LDEAYKSAGFVFEYEEKGPGNSSNERTGDIKLKTGLVTTTLELKYQTKIMHTLALGYLNCNLRSQIIGGL
jgi:hypothetical protein